MDSDFNLTEKDIDSLVVLLDSGSDSDIFLVLSIIDEYPTVSEELLTKIYPIPLCQDQHYMSFKRLIQHTAGMLKFWVTECSDCIIENTPENREILSRLSLYGIKKINN